MALHTNADSSVTPEERAKRERDARNDAIVQSAVEDAKRLGPMPREYTEDGQVFATHDQIADTKAYAVGDRPFIQPIGYRLNPTIPGGIEWKLTEADAGAVRAGLACQRCLDYYPATWTPACPSCLLQRDANVGVI